MMKRTLFEGRDGKIKLLGRTKSRKRKKEYDRERDVGPSCTHVNVFVKWCMSYAGIELHENFLGHVFIMGQYRPLLRLFSVFSSTQYNINNKSI